MSIPIRNLYYLLSYAWNKLEIKENVEVSIDDNTELLDLFAKVLISATKILIKRGTDRNYNKYEEELVGVKGKILFSETIKSNILFKQRTICAYDDLSHNILLNRLLFSTIYKLTRTQNIDHNLKIELTVLLKLLPTVDKIQITNSLFKQIKINRNNKFYRLIMDVCRTIFENTLPAEEQGKYIFSDFTRDNNKMHRLFEAFIRNFYTIEQKKYNIVKKERIKWQFEKALIDSTQFIPKMETDITLENENAKIIIDAKYHSETMSVNYSIEKIKSNNLYQLFSYLLNQENSNPKTIKAKGILLYPTIEKDYNLQYKYKNHLIEIRTVNLSSDCKSIDARLKEIIGIEV